MGLAQDTIARWAQAAPTVEADEAWPPFVRPQPGTRIELVCRWDEGKDPGWFWRQVCRFAYWSSRGEVWLTPQRLHVIGPASSEEIAEEASLDGTYCSFPMTVDCFLPRESVNLRGVRFWKRKLHRLWWHTEPKEQARHLLVDVSDVRALREEVEALRRLINE